MHPLKHPIPPQPHSLFVSWAVPRDWRGCWGRPGSSWGWRGGSVCVKLDPLIQKPSLGTTAGTRLLLGLSTVAPHEQQKATPNAACSSPLNTHAHTEMELNINTQHTQLQTATCSLWGCYFFFSFFFFLNC